MYNKEIKENFINSLSVSQSTKDEYIILFNILESYEEKWNADFCTMKLDDIRPIVDKVSGIRSKTKNIRLRYLQKYSQWCIDNNIEGACADVLMIKEIGNSKLKKTMVANPQHLQRYLDYIYLPESYETSDNRFRTIFWLVYSGIKENEVVNILTSEVNLSNMLIKHNDKEYVIYKEALQSIKNCVYLDSFRYIHPCYSDEKKVYKNRAKGNILIRGFNDNNSLQSILDGISKKTRNKKYADKDSESLDLRPTLYTIWLSGQFYRMYESEKAGVPVDFLYLTKDLNYNLSSTNTSLFSKQKSVASEYYNDYMRWKDVFQS